jgi:hypothetical protein
MTKDPASELGACRLLVAFYCLLHAALYLWVVPEDAWREGGDLGTYLDPAVGLYRHGAFVQPDDPAAPSLYRLPLYTVVVAAGLAMTGGESPRPTLIVNLALLLGTGLLMRRVASAWLPRRADLVLALILFNPLLVGTAYILQPLNLNAFWYALAGWLLLRDRSPPNPADILGVGIVAGLAALTRPGGQVLIAALPLAVPILAKIMDRRVPLPRTVVAALSAAAIGAAITVPWMVYAERSGHGFRLSSVEHNTLFIRDNNSSLEFYRRGGSLQDAKDRVFAEIEAWRAEQGEAYASLAPPQKAAATNDFLVRRFLIYPPTVALQAWSMSVGNLLFGGGATNLRSTLGIEAPKAWDKVVLEGYNTFTAFLAAVSEMSPTAVLVSVLSVGFALLCRAVGLIGIVAASRRGDWPPLVASLGLVAYFAVIHVFVGESVYRVPIESYLALLAAYGVDAAAEHFRRSG